MTSQYRISQEKFSWEFVGGFIDKGEKSEESAYREMLEESGYKCNNLVLLGKVAPMVSKCNNTGYIYYTDDVEYKEKNLEQMEEFVNLTSSWVSIKDVKKAILKGDMYDATSLAAWSLYREHIQYG
jgi:ADP-ribose pyrophosphatase